ncbi:MAG: hypothetical protein ACXQTM_01125 [Methanosarcinales archaeon]
MTGSSLKGAILSCLYYHVLTQKTLLHVLGEEITLQEHRRDERPDHHPKPADDRTPKRARQQKNLREIQEIHRRDHQRTPPDDTTTPATDQTPHTHKTTSTSATLTEQMI